MLIAISSSVNIITAPVPSPSAIPAWITGDSCKASASFTAAGSTVTGDVPADSLAVARARQKNLEGWAAKRRADGKLK